MLNVHLKSAFLMVFATLSVSSAQAVCISNPGQILSAPAIRQRMDHMGTYQNLVGTYHGKLKKFPLTFPITIHIIHHKDKFFLKMEWTEVFSKKSASHAFRVCANDDTGANALYLIMNTSPFPAGAPYKLGGLRHFKVFGHTSQTMTLDLSPDELDPRFGESDLVVKNIRKAK